MRNVVITLKASIVKSGSRVEFLCRLLFVVNCVNDDGESSKKHIEELVKVAVVDDDPGKESEEASPELRENQDHVLVEVVQNQNGVFAIAFSPVDQKESAEVLELPDGVVTRSSSLLTFHPSDSNANMGGSYHVHIVGPISNRQSGKLRELKGKSLLREVLEKRNYFVSDHRDNFFFLLWGNTTRQNSLAVLADLHEALCQMVFMN